MIPLQVVILEFTDGKQYWFVGTPIPPEYTAEPRKIRISEPIMVPSIFGSPSAMPNVRGKLLRMISEDMESQEGPDDKHHPDQ
jgi:hypothetical protein